MSDDMNEKELEEFKKNMVTLLTIFKEKQCTIFHRNVRYPGDLLLLNRTVLYS